MNFFLPLDNLSAGVNDIPPQTLMLWVFGMVFCFVIAPAIYSHYDRKEEPKRNLTSPRDPEQVTKARQAEVLNSVALQLELEHCKRFSAAFYPYSYISGLWVSRQEVLTEYHEWCSKRLDEVNMRPLTDERLLSTLEAMGWVPSKSNGMAGYAGRPSRRARRKLGLERNGDYGR